MKQSRRYRIKSPTMAIFSSDGQRKTITVPIGVIVIISEDPQQGDRLIDVVYNDQGYMMFTQDLRERGEPLD
jgi:hypothetical protein